MEHLCETIEREDGVVIVSCTECDWQTNVTERRFVAATVDAHRCLAWDWPWETPSAPANWYPSNK